MPEFTNWLMDIGISKDILLVLTFVPIIVTITTASRYITGIKTFGVYTSMVLAFAGGVSDGRRAGGSNDTPAGYN